MKIQATNEQEMMNSQAPSPESIEELNEYIQSCLDVVNNHDEKNEDEVSDAYGRCVYALSLSAQAAFNYVAKTLGVSGFQAGAADLNFVSRTRGINGPFMIVTFEDLLYPNQFNPQAKINDVLASQSTREWLIKELMMKINTNNKNTPPEYMTHWKQLLSQLVPQDQPVENPALANKKAKAKKES